MQHLLLHLGFTADFKFNLCTDVNIDRWFFCKINLFVFYKITYEGLSEYAGLILYTLIIQISRREFL